MFKIFDSALQIIVVVVLTSTTVFSQDCGLPRDSIRSSAFAQWKDEVSVNLFDTNEGKAIGSAIVKGNLQELRTLLREANKKNPIIESYGDGFGAGTVLHSSAALGKFDIFKEISATL